MILFKTTEDQILHLASIVVDMKSAGLPPRFIVDAYRIAQTDQGVYDLMALWAEAANDPHERDEIIADIQESVDDYGDAQSAPKQKPKINFDQLDDVITKVKQEKKRLRDLIDQHGGVSAVARKAGIAQPSLSRTLNDDSIPRRSTLYKIANALDLSEADIALEWAR